MTSVQTVDSHGTPVETEVFAPPGASNRGAIIIAHGSDGLSERWADMIRGYAGELAEAGYTALIPHYFDKTGTAAGRDLATLQTSLSCWQETVSDTVAYAATLPGVSAARIGLLGFSLGGHICLRVRGSGTALVAYFAPELVEFGGLNFPSAPALHAQIHHGLADVVVPFSDAKSIAAGLTLEGGEAVLFAYEGAGHGFAGADTDNATASRSAKNRTLAFFERLLP